MRTVVNIRQEAGEWICAVPYGYVITNAKKALYEVVPDEAEVVREVFRLYSVEGWGYKKIANHLTEMGIPTARMKEKARVEARGDKYNRSAKPEWSIVSVQGMLKNDFYIGTLRQKKYSRKTINGKDVKLDEGEHLVFLKHHESIVDDKTFLYTQELLEKRTTSNYRGVKKYDTMYSGVLYCGDCGSPMFSMSRPDLAPAYTCGTYHKRGLKGCTSHHMRTDFLDTALKDYLRMVKENSAEMIRELEAAVASESSSVKENADLIELIESQLYKAKEELKATQKQKVKAVMKNPDAADIYEETHREIEDEILGRIESLTRQRELTINKRAQIIELAMASKTVFDVFDNVLNKDKLDKVDIALIVDRINVYEGGIVDIRLKADIETLLKTGKLPGEEVPPTFKWDSIDISSMTAIYRPKVRNQADKVYTVNIISEGEGLLIRIIVRPIPSTDCYEILAGHNRAEAAKLNGWEKIGAEIVEADDVRAITIATVTNLIQRQELGIVERGKAYKALLDAKKRQGCRSDLEDGTSGENRQKYSARALVAEFFGVTEYEIRKVIKLTQLIPELQTVIEQTPKQLSLACADLMAEYDADTQAAFIEMCSIEGCRINKATMQHITHACPPPAAQKQDILAVWREAMADAEKRQIAPPKKITFDRKKFAPYLDKLGSDKDIEALFLQFLQERVG